MVNGVCTWVVVCCLLALAFSGEPVARAREQNSRLAGDGQCCVSASLAPTSFPLAVTDESGAIVARERTHITVLYTASGRWVETSNAYEVVPALSLIKLLIAEYVIRHADGPGAAADQTKALEMVQGSDDEAAKELFEKYPASIRIIVKEENLRSTWVGNKWGAGVTTTGDMVRFLHSLVKQNSPVIEAMEAAHEIAADGYAQNFGTATLPGVTGTKFGWSNDRRSFHSTASVGNGFIVVASTQGSRQQHTADVTGAFTHHTCVVSPMISLLPAAPTSVEAPARDEWKTILLLPEAMPREEQRKYASFIGLLPALSSGSCSTDDIEVLPVTPVQRVPSLPGDAMQCTVGDNQVNPHPVVFADHR